MALKIILIITIPCIVVFTIMPERLLNILYSNKLNAFGYDGLKISARLLVWSGFGIVFLAISQVYSSSLQAIEKRFATIRNLSIAVIVKFIIELLFLPSRHLNILTLAIANTACYITMMVLNHFEIKQYFNIKVDYMFAVKLAFANFASVFAMIIVMILSNSVINTIIAGLFGVLVYFYSLMKLKILNKRDLAMLKYKV